MSPPAQLEELETLPALPPSAPPSFLLKPDVLSCTWCHEAHTIEECLAHSICPQRGATGHQPLTCLVLADSTEMVRRARMVEGELRWQLWQQLSRDTRKCRDDEVSHMLPSSLLALIIIDLHLDRERHHERPDLRPVLGEGTRLQSVPVYPVRQVQERAVRVQQDGWLSQCEWGSTGELFGTSAPASADISATHGVGGRGGGDAGC